MFSICAAILSLTMLASATAPIPLLSLLG